ncbi:hypothetical protein [Microvirga lotononidis]|uniref:Uncharacterized protein n=1 Tax=Microvirga lotononidis TaxID=864069 RepID=I4YN11_9HYPH|nr:hypothetical protein [Microvirga lotononidis]EIM25353.1 hypothetical protein MicloDRAFT_00060790 [Microvirga lotononidis]WQO27346.1 hypothetical protein U0023_22325 [Microvirga lotononidis]
MRHLILLCASIVPMLAFVANEAFAQRRFGGGGFHGGGIRAGGFGGGGFRPAIRPGFRPGGVAPGRFGPGYRPGFVPGRTRWQVGPDRRWGPSWRPSPYRPYPYRRGWVGPAYWGPGYYPYGYYGGWGWGAAGLATGVAIGAAAASTYPAYATPVPTGSGGYCATPVRTCALTSRAPLGTGCSCRVSGGRGRGGVVGP